MNKYYKSFTTIFLVTLCVSLGSAQSFFHQYIGNDVWGESARSQSMGATNAVSDQSAGLLLNNPAGLSNLHSGINVSVNFHGNSVLERRGFRLFDTFGDFLTYGDYVSNRQRYSDSQIGFTGNFNFKGFQIGAGLAYGTLLNFDYLYQEEVRGRENFDDGIIGIRDPLIGYHILESTGTMDMTSFGFSAKFNFLDNQYLNFGFGHHFAHEVDVRTDTKIEQLSDIPGFLSNITPGRFLNELDSGTFNTIALEWSGLMGIRAAVVFETELALDRNERNFLYNPDTDEYDEVIIETLVPVVYSDFERPSRLSIAVNYTPREQTPMSLAFQFKQIDKTEWTEEINSWQFGFEYMALRTVPVRAGIIYRDTPAEIVDPESIFTFGTGKQFGNLSVDLAGSYRVNTYYFEDLFTVDGDVRPEYDRVRESQFNYTISLTYGI